MEIPACPSCGGTAWSCEEELAGGSRKYELRADGWTLVESSLELLQTDYACDDCGRDPADDDAGDDLLELLADIDTAPSDDIAADRRREDVTPGLWELDPTPV
jgi:hypothetical protein